MGRKTSPLTGHEFDWKKMKFTDEMAAAFPKRNPLPDVLRQALQFMEELGCVRTRRDGSRYMTVYPDPEHDNVTANAFHVPDPADTAGWTHCNDPEVNDRLVIFLRTGGDGSWAGLWLDDDGQQRIVHLGSGSGSVMLCVLTENMEDLLRLLAIGYTELCWPDDFERTPDEVFEEQCDDDDDDTPPPLLFQDYVKEKLRLSIPERASEIVSSTVSMDEVESRDPFWNWIKRLNDQ